MLAIFGAVSNCLITIENLHMMCKHVLGVQKQTTNAGVLFEIGRIPLMGCKILCQKLGASSFRRGE